LTKIDQGRNVADEAGFNSRTGMKISASGDSRDGARGEVDEPVEQSKPANWMIRSVWT
jgi:hypothetical protein